MRNGKNDKGNEDFDDDDFGMEDDSFDDFEKKEQTLGDLWRNNPAIKVGSVAGGLVLVLIVLFSFGGGSDPVSTSLVPPGPEISAPPATEEVSPAMADAIRQENRQRNEEARRTGESVLPTPIEPPRTVLPLAQDERQQEDPLERWKRLQEERLQREMQRAETVQPEPVIQDNTARNEALQALTEIMSEQMQAILETRTQPVNISSASLTSPDFLERLEEERLAELEERQQQNNAERDGEEDVPPALLMPAGQIAYAQLLTEANSDVPGPVLAQIVSGPLKGSRILGDFTVQRDLLTLNFNTVVIDDQSIGVSAIALDPDTTLPGLATEVDRRYFQRIILPAAAAFVEGAAEAIAESGRTTVTIQGETVSEETEEADSQQEIATGVQEAGEELGEIFDELSDVEVLVRIEAGTPLGILFLEPVFEETNNRQPIRNANRDRP